MESRPFIRLDQFLKQQGVVATGGHAKIVIQNGEVRVNNAVETRRGKKLYAGDVVKFANAAYAVDAEMLRE